MGLSPKTKGRVELQVGDPAPDFDAHDEVGQRHSLESYRGKTVVLYFYPKDSTPGCTVQACDFRDSYQQFLAKGAVVLGVSLDSASAHQRFKSRHQLPFPLLVDEGARVCRAYGTYRDTLLGRLLGAERSTFVIGPDGLLKAVFRKVSPRGHADEMLSAV